MVETLAPLGLKQLARSRGRRDLPAAPAIQHLLHHLHCFPLIAIAKTKSKELHAST